MKDFLIRNSLTLVSILTLSLALSGVAYAAAFAGVLWWIYVIMSPIAIFGSIAAFACFVTNTDKAFCERMKESLGGKEVTQGFVLSSVNILLMVGAGWVFVPAAFLFTAFLLRAGLYSYNKNNEQVI